MPFDTIAKNSERLINEAFDAFQKKHYATSTALSIFSIEEAAKFVICKRERKREDIPRKRVFKHEVKHEEIGKLFWYWAIFSVLSETFKDFKTFAESKPDTDPKTMEFIGNLSGGDAVDLMRYHMFTNEEEMREYVKKEFSHPELLEISEAGKSGAVEALRRKCLYVDLSEDRSDVTSSPDEISEEDANEWLKIAWFGQEYIKLANRIWN